MIKNVPDAVEMEQTAIRLYFTAWEHVMEVIAPTTFLAGNAVKIVGRSLVPCIKEGEYSPWSLDEIKDMLEDFVGRAQPDLHLCYALIQQSQEIALKARLCAVSPYLLLLGSDIKNWARPEGDFTDFRTLDAVDLVRVVNLVCSNPVSNKFSTQFDIIRKGRNKIQHLGSFKNKIDPIATLDILVDQWLELFQNKSWIAELYNVTSSEQRELLRDDRFTATTIVLNEVAALDKVLTKSQKRKLLGLPAKARLFNCWNCYYEAGFDRYEEGLGNYQTAYLMPEDAGLHCVSCASTFQIQRRKCVEVGCRCSIVVQVDSVYRCALCLTDQNLYYDIK